MKNMNQFLNRVNTRNFTNNTQRVLHRLLVANGEWVSGNELSRVVRVSTGSNVNDSTTARVRDLRKSQFGNFDVECASAVELNRSGVRRFFYRVNPKLVTARQVTSVLVAE